tara:strand:- start:28 stop:411 length:384 start_codon:yes stop_codon:yes gene_type:complete
MTADIIKGPWAKTSSKSTVEEIEMAKILAECDQITSDCTIAVLQNLVESGIAPEDPDDENITYIMFLTELLKAVTYKSVNIEHPFQDIVSLLCGAEYHINNEKHYYIDYHKVEDAINYLKSREKDPA